MSGLMKYQWNYFLAGLISLTIIQHIDAKLFDKEPNRQVVLQNVDNCADYPNALSLIKANLKKHNRTMQLFSGNVTIKEDFSDKLNIHVEVKRWGTGGWKNNFLRVDSPKACSTAFKILGDALKHVMMNAGLKEPKCPIPKGTYVVTDWPLDLSKVPLAVVTGRLMLRALVKNKEEVFVCVDAVLEVKAVA